MYVGSDGAKIISELAKEKKVSMTELASRLCVSRNAVYLMLKGNMSFGKFMECMGVLGYGITIRPLDTSESNVDVVNGSMCSNCVHKKLSEALQSVQNVRDKE